MYKTDASIVNQLYEKSLTMLKSEIPWYLAEG